MFLNNYKYFTGILIIGLMDLWNSATCCTSVGHQELVTFAIQIETTIKNGNPAYYNQCFNREFIINRIVSREAFKPGDEQTQEFIDVLNQIFDPGALLTNLVATGGSFTFIRAYQEEGVDKMLFRLSSNEGISYHEYQVDSYEGKIIITDGYIFNTGQTVSEMIRNTYHEYVSGLCRYHEVHDLRIHNLMSAGKYRKAYKKWSSLPESIRHSEKYQLLGIRIAEKIDRKQYFRIYYEFSKYFPEEPGKYLIPLSGLVWQGYEQEALNNIDKLEDMIQGDPFLHLIRAQIYLKAGDPDGARHCLNTVIEAMPQCENGYISLLDLCLTRKNYDEATEVLGRLVAAFNAYKEDLLPLLQNHPEFLESAQYKKWLEN